MQSIRPPAAADTLKLILLGAIWSSAFMCIEVALEDFSPVAIASWRIVIAALALLPVVVLTGRGVPRDARTWGLFAAAGLLYNALPFTLISWGQQFISSGTTSIAIASGTFISLVLSHFLTHDDRFTVPKLTGVTLGFIGVVILIGADALDGTPDAVAGQLAIVAAVTLYILSSLIIRRITGVPAVVISAGILLTSAAYMGPAALLYGHALPLDPGWKSIAALLYLGLVPTAFAYLLRIQIIQQVGTTFLSQVSLLIPVFGLLWGWLFLTEVPTQASWIALAFVLGGMIVARLRWRPSRTD
jgi:drug/metabolite transporter (DMT)-like permease